MENGQRAIAFTEHGRVSSWISKKMYCDQNGIKYIHGVEIYLTESLEEKIRDNFHTVLLARNWEGVKELNALLSKSFEPDHFYFTNRISFEEFLNISDNIISTSACLASPLNKLPDECPWIERLIEKYTFLEIQPHQHPDQVRFNQKLWELSKKTGTPLIAGTDTHSLNVYKAECRSVLMYAKRKSYGDEDSFDLTYKTYDKLVNGFKRQGALPEDVYLEAIENTNRMADAVESFELDRSIKYPILYGSRKADIEKFEETVQVKFDKKREEGIIPNYQVHAFRAAIEEEMRVFKKLDMCGFLLSMSELISWCKANGLAVGAARGSVGGSRVAFVTDIIDLNPETWKTVFSRFCNEDRVEVGDIDIDCVESDRPRIFDHIIQRFGKDKTARVASYGTLADKSVIDEVGRGLCFKWEETQHGVIPKDAKSCHSENPYSLKKVDAIKKEYVENPESAKTKYPELFYYYDGLAGTKISQSVHPAGMVISPVTLPDNYGVFDKDGINCLMMDMDEAHDIGLVKYDFLALKTVKVIRDTCAALQLSYPQTHEIDWEDPLVWQDMCADTTAIFQFESAFASDCLKKFKPESIFDMSLVTACIRPSGASYRNDLLNKIPHKNPSTLIDDLLKDNNGYLVYQEDVIKFLQQVCGLSGSEADNVRRAIGHKDFDRLQKALPDILAGYCKKSSSSEEQATLEAKTFIKIIEDASSYMFGYNHSIAYCLLGYLCAYYRYYNPLEFITSYLNNAANEDDIKNGSILARKKGIAITQPKFGISKGEYFFSKERNIIAKGLTSVKNIGKNTGEELFQLSQNRTYDTFTDLLLDIFTQTSVDIRELDILTKIDFFSDFGNQRELLMITNMFELFRRGKAKQIDRKKVDGTPLEDIVIKHASCKTKAGKEAKKYTLLDTIAIIKECEQYIRSMHVDDIGIVLKAQNFKDIMGYAGYVSGREEDRNKLYIRNVFPVHRKRDGVLFGYSVLTQSIGSGIESRFTVFKGRFDKDPIKKDDIIACKRWTRDGVYFQMNDYEHIVC